MIQNKSVPTSPSGYSAEPEPSCTVSAVPVSIPNALNPDAYAFIVLQGEYREQMERHAYAQRECVRLRDLAERAEADAKTASERATSIMETLLKLEPPRDAPNPNRRET